MSTVDIDKDCVFCKIVTEMDETKVTEVTPAVIMFEPLNPVTDGHLLLVPKKHVTDMSESVNTMRFMGEAIAIVTKAFPECNVITSKGKNATQTVFHLHIHIVPREKDDGLALPWTGQHLKAELLAKLPMQHRNVGADIGDLRKKGYNQAITDITKIVNEL